MPQIHSAGNCKHTKNGFLVVLLRFLWIKIKPAYMYELVFFGIICNKLYIFFASKVLVLTIGLVNAPAWDHIFKDDLSKLEEFGERVSTLSMKHLVFFFAYNYQSIFHRLVRHFHNISFSRQHENINVSI